MSTNDSISTTTTPYDLHLLLVQCANLAILCFQVPLSVVNVCVLVRTSLLHANLKFVLLTQSVCFCAFAASRSAQIALVNAFGQQNWLNWLPIQWANCFCIVFFNVIGHALLAERVLATVWAKDYEHWNNKWFGVAWFIPVLSFSLFNGFQQAQMSLFAMHSGKPLTLTFGMMFTNFCALGMTFFEMIVFAILGSHNLKRFEEGLSNQQNNKKEHNLSERYQLAENIRTTRQLAPTFTFHFLNMLFTMPMIVVLYYGIVHDGNILNVAFSVECLGMSLCNLLTEFTLIRRHPIMRKNALKLLRQLRARLCCAKASASIGDAGGLTNGSGGNNGTAANNNLFIRTNNPRASNYTNETEKHFELLKRGWEVGAK